MLAGWPAFSPTGMCASQWKLYFFSLPPRSKLWLIALVAAKAVHSRSEFVVMFKGLGKLGHSPAYLVLEEEKKMLCCEKELASVCDTQLHRDSSLGWEVEVICVRAHAPANSHVWELSLLCVCWWGLGNPNIVKAEGRQGKK